MTPRIPRDDELGDLSMDDYRRARRGEPVEIPDPPVPGEQHDAALLAIVRRSRTVDGEIFDDLDAATVREMLDLPATPLTAEGHLDDERIDEALRSWAERHPKHAGPDHEPAGTDPGSMTMAEYREHRRTQRWQLGEDHV